MEGNLLNGSLLDSMQEDESKLAKFSLKFVGINCCDKFFVAREGIQNDKVAVPYLGLIISRSASMA